MLSANLTASLYLVSGIFFILALRGLSSPETSRTGNLFGIVGMTLAIVVTLFSIKNTEVLINNFAYILIPLVIGGLIGAIIAARIAMTSMPQLVAGFHSLVGLSAVLIAISAFYNPQSFGIGTFGNIKFASIIEMSLGVAIGAITFSGSCIAFLKLQGLMSGSPITFRGQHFLNLLIGLIIIFLIGYLSFNQSENIFWTLTILSILVGFLIIIPIGGADMPVVVSMLNSYSGWAAAGIGFTLENTALIITGALVGSSGAILSYIMCKGMNRSLFNVILGGFGSDESSTSSSKDNSGKPVKQAGAEDAAFLMKNASSVIIVPGYGMAVAQAQHALKEMVDKLKQNGVKVSYAIHPVAGRMPGHMNVLLAEANVPYDDVFELENINNDFSNTDVSFVIGANDVTNPAAKTDKTSPIFGMPILDVEKSKSVLFVKRSLSSGYAGVDNELFYKDNTLMLFADAKKMVEEISKALD
jgi:NAD(P) transhydrogenase subunit beta